MPIHDIIAWVSLLFGGGALITVGKLLIDIGDRKRRLEAIEEERAGDAARLVAIEKDLVDYKLEAERMFAHKGVASEIEQRLTTAIDGLRLDFRGLAARIDRYLEQQSAGR